MGLDAEVHELVPVGYQPLLQPGFFLQSHLSEAVGAVQANGEEQIPENLQQLGGLVRHGLAAEEKPGHPIPGIRPRRGEKLGVDAARLAADALAQPDVVLPVGPHLREGATQKGRVGEKLPGEGVEVEPEVQVKYPVGEYVVGEETGLPFPMDFDGDDLVGSLQVPDFEHGDGGEGFGRVGPGLELSKLQGVLDQLAQLRFRQSALDPRQVLAHFRFLTLGQLGVGLQQHGGAVGIAEQQRVDELRQEPLLGLDPVSDGGEGLLEGEKGQGIPVIKPGGQCAQHEHQSTGVHPRVVLPKPELQRVDRGLHGLLVNAFPGQSGQGLQNEGLHLAAVLGLNPLEPHGKKHLTQLIFQAVAGQVVTEARFDERFPEGSARHAEERVVQDAESEVHFGIQRVTQKPVDGDHGFGSGRVGAAIPFLPGDGVKACELP